MSPPDPLGAAIAAYKQFEPGTWRSYPSPTRRYAALYRSETELGTGGPSAGPFTGPAVGRCVVVRDDGASLDIGRPFGDPVSWDPAGDAFFVSRKIRSGRSFEPYAVDLAGLRAGSLPYSIDPASLILDDCQAIRYTRRRRRSIGTLFGMKPAVKYGKEVVALDFADVPWKPLSSAWQEGRAG